MSLLRNRLARLTAVRSLNLTPEESSGHAWLDDRSDAPPWWAGLAAVVGAGLLVLMFVFVFVFSGRDGRRQEDVDRCIDRGGAAVLLRNGALDRCIVDPNGVLAEQETP